MRSVSKQQIVDSISGRLLLQKSDTEKIINAFIDEVKNCFRKGQRIEIHQFGTFLPHLKKSRTVIAPKTGVEHKVPERTILKFKASKHMYIYHHERMPKDAGKKRDKRLNKS